jgi:hypothetical protein
METNRLLPLSGIAFVALVILAIPVLGWGSPSSTTAPAEVVAYYQEHNAEQFVASIVIAASVPFLVLFALGLGAARTTPGGRSTWQRMLVGGSFDTGAVLLVIALTNFALADGADNGASADAIQALNLIIGNAWVGLNAGLGVLMLGAAGTFLSRPRSGWIGWTALVLGVALFIPIADFFALLLTGPWMIATGVALSRRPEQRHVAHPAPSLT